MRRRIQVLAVGGIVLLILAGGVALSACGSDDSSEGPAATQANEDEPDPSGGGSTLVAILTDFVIADESGSGEYQASAGEVTFDVRNDGVSIHELAVVRTDLDPAELPESDALIVDEEQAGELLGRTELLAVGDSESLTLELESGSYALICNIAGHYDSGMFTSLTVQ